MKRLNLEQDINLMFKKTITFSFNEIGMYPFEIRYTTGVVLVRFSDLFSGHLPFLALPIFAVPHFLHFLLALRVIPRHTPLSPSTEVVMPDVSTPVKSAAFPPVSLSTSIQPEPFFSAQFFKTFIMPCFHLWRLSVADAQLKNSLHIAPVKDRFETDCKAGYTVGRGGSIAIVIEDKIDTIFDTLLVPLLFDLAFLHVEDTLCNRK